MTPARQWGACVLTAFLGVAGCAGSGGTHKVSTGADDTARAFFTALVNRDWPAAYQLLGADSQAKCSSDEFRHRAEAYCRGLGFDPTEAVIQSCDERGGEAVAHVNLRRMSGGSVQHAREAVALRRSAGGWAVTLPSTFGKPRR
jgi:hypothetical protein